MRFPHQRSANAIAAPSRPTVGLASINLRRAGRWISLITESVAEVWAQMAREREIKCMRKAWATMDDRTLRDIGVSRLEMAYTKVSSARGGRKESHPPL
jgi:uncharacterized protein YjiS (DUF1127 family)